MDPSDTAMAGTGILIISAAQELEHSLCARCNAITRSLERDEHHSVAGKPDFVQKDRVEDLAGERSDEPELPEPGGLAPEGRPVASQLGAMGLLKRSHERRARSSLAALSILLVLEYPQDLHHQRFVPAFVCPFSFIAPPQTSHLGLFKASFRPLDNFPFGKLA